MESLRTSETEQFHCYVPSVPSVSFLVKSPYVIFNISTSRSPVMLLFKILMFFKFVKRLYTAFKNFHVKHICIMKSGCIFKNGAPPASSEKSAQLNQIRLMLYHKRERKKKGKMHISFIFYIYWASYATFSIRRFY